MTATPGVRNRWTIALAGTIVMICLGSVHSWSIFTRPLIASFNWSNTDTSLVFSAAIFFLGLGAFRFLSRSPQTRRLQPHNDAV